ncbi:MAG: hypothetical protein QOC89_1077 [Paraburkholderia sp.]|jgi:hypothetical protein|nr:hypothetical protein [Paraburkholderia sp.]
MSINGVTVTAASRAAPGSTLLRTSPRHCASQFQTGIFPFAFRAPLWFYILREAELPPKNDTSDKAGGHHPGPVGGRVVAEVLVGIALNDHTSYLCQERSWTPALEKSRSGFDAGQHIDSVFDLIHGQPPEPCR